MGRPKKYSTDAERQRAYRLRKSRALRNGLALQNPTEFIGIDRPALRYFGGKWRIAEWIISQFPAHTCYVEPFVGGGSVLLQKAPARFEVMNDLDGDVIAFFDVLRSDPEALIRAIELTPYSREELRRARTSGPATEQLERARRLYVRCWQSYGSGTGKAGTGWRYQIGAGERSGANAVGSWNKTEHLWGIARRLKQVQIECDDAFKVIQRFDSPETLFYIDPPYVHSTRYEDSHRKGYSVEMSDNDHIALGQLLNSVKGMVVLSGYPSELYQQLYHDWQYISRESQDINSKLQTECLWLSPNLARLSALPLFR